MEKSKIIYPELSYKIIGFCYELFNEIGGSVPEKAVKKGLKLFFAENNLRYKEELYWPIVAKGEILGSYYFDFLIDGKIVLELKVGDKLKLKDYEQLKDYLDQNKLKLGLLVRFGRDGVEFRRILNLY